MAEPLRVLIVSSEAAPFAVVGGLGAVVGDLTTALADRGLDVRLVLPRYARITRDQFAGEPISLCVPLGAQERWCAVGERKQNGLTLYFLEHDDLYDRPYVYGPPGGEFADNCLRFALLCRGALQLCSQLEWWPQVAHVHDWPGALLPVYLNTIAQNTPLAGTASVLTIHNLAYQGWFDRTHSAAVGLDDAPLAHLGLAAGEGINLLRAGILHSTMITTVSPSYAQEIQSMGHGEGLDNLISSRRADIFGVLNGIDLDVWNPATDALLPANYTADDLSGKRYCKAALQQRVGLSPRPEVPLIGLISRLVEQKGIDLLASAIDPLLDLDVQIALLGVGDAWAEHFFTEVMARHPDRFAASITFDEELAHLITAGSDLLLMPSLWEPCGLNQMYAQRYGTLPIVRATGGLKDTVENLDEASGSGTGFVFYDATAEALIGVVTWALRVLREQPTVHKAMIQRAMALPRGWDRAAAIYEYLYRLAVVRRHGG